LKTKAFEKVGDPFLYKKKAFEKRELGSCLFRKEGC
jgi:hypothetical protein